MYTIYEEVLVTIPGRINNVEYIIFYIFSFLTLARIWVFWDRDPEVSCPLNVP